MTEIKPRLVDGESVCSTDCPQFDRSGRIGVISIEVNRLPSVCRGSALNGCTCWEGVKQQRDEARKERDELWHALQSLTPQGSDDGEPLCGTPEECVAYVRELKRELEKFRRMQDSGMVLDI